MTFGYHGRILVINASKRSWQWEAIDESILRKFIGGTGLAAYLLYQYCPQGAEPLGPENPLIFCTSPLVGTQITTSSKFVVCTKSPQTGFIGDSMSSSFLATEIKSSGADAVILVGMSEEWMSIRVSSNGVTFDDAGDLIGLTTSATEKRLKEAHGDRYRVACIGPAGENLVKYASISNDGGRQAGRTGSGAVMGSKKIKALCFSGNNAVSVCDGKALSDTRKRLSVKSIGHATEKYRNLGTIANLSVFNRLGILPSNNFRNSAMPDVEHLSAETFYGQGEVKKAHCANCTIGCEKLITIPGSKSEKVRMEYQSLYAMGPLNGVSDQESVLKNSKFCDEMGIDTISAGATIAWYLECSERGLLESSQAGSDASVDSLLDLLVHRKGIGNVLAEGSAKGSDIIGAGSEKLAMHVKGLELPGYEPRTLKALALAMAVSTRGACHNRSSAYDWDFSNRDDSDADAVGKAVIDGEDYSAVMDSLIWCKFIRKVFDDFYVESSVIINEVTGWDMTAEELKKCGERINNLKKLFNIREGWKSDDDTLPHRILTEPVNEGPNEGDRLSENQLNVMIDSYYRVRGWEKDGTIPSQKLKDMDLYTLM